MHCKEINGHLRLWLIFISVGSTSISLSNYSGRLRRLSVSSCHQITDNSLSALRYSILHGQQKEAFLSISIFFFQAKPKFRYLCSGFESMSAFFLYLCIKTVVDRLSISKPSEVIWAAIGANEWAIFCK